MADRRSVQNVQIDEVCLSKWAEKYQIGRLLTSFILVANIEVQRIYSRITGG